MPLTNSKPQPKLWLKTGAKAALKISGKTRNVFKNTPIKEKNSFVSALQDVIGATSNGIRISNDAITSTSSGNKIDGCGGLQADATCIWASKAYALALGILTLFIWILFKKSCRRNPRCRPCSR